MPGLISQPVFKHLSIKELHPTFGAEVSGVDFSQPVPDNVTAEILQAMAKYGVCVFRKTALDDDSHVAFSRQFGELDDMRPHVKRMYKNGYRLKHLELFDVSNLSIDGSLAPPDSMKAAFSKGNTLFHVDSSYNPRRAGYSLLLAHVLPPPNTGGETLFADTRTAFDDLGETTKDRLLAQDYVAAHSLLHSRKTAAPDFFKDENPEDHRMVRHRLVQMHEPSGRMNLYLSAHVHHIEGVDRAESDRLIEQLARHAAKPEHCLELAWQSPGDLVIWDNTCVMHRAKGGAYVGTHKRDLRRTTVHDSSPTAWGLNNEGAVQVGLP